MTITATTTTEPDFEVGDEVRAERSVLPEWRDLQGVVEGIDKYGHVRVVVDELGKTYTFYPSSLVKVETCYSVHDAAGFATLGRFARVTDSDGDILRRDSDGRWRYHSFLRATVEPYPSEGYADEQIADDSPFLVEPSVLGQYIDSRDGFSRGDEVAVTTDTFSAIPKGSTGKIIDIDPTFIQVLLDEGTAAVFPFEAGELALAGKVEDVPAFNVGDLVTVSADAKTALGGGVYFGQEIVAEVALPVGGSGNQLVRSLIATEGFPGGRTQYVAPQYLTLVRAATPEPVDEALPTIHDQAGLDALPVGSVIRLLDYYAAYEPDALAFKSRDDWRYGGSGLVRSNLGYMLSKRGAEVLFIND